MRTSAKQMAQGGVTAALAVVLMSLGGLIPVATYTTPMLCVLLLQTVLKLCGSRTAWAWYGAVSVLSLLLGPDQEAAGVFLFLGYYPIVKPRLEKWKFPWVWKLLLFNGMILLLYTLLLRLVGMEALEEEFTDLTTWLLALLLGMGNLIFFLLDKILDRFPIRFRKG